MAHRCHAAGCSQNVPPTMLMCRRHWGMVPWTIKKRVLTHYRPGQCDDWQITHEYAEAARDAVRSVAEREGVGSLELRKALMVYDMLDPVKKEIEDEASETS